MPEDDRSWSSDKAAPRGTGVLTKAFDVLDEIAASQGQTTARDIGEATGIPRPTLYRILSAMATRGLVRYDSATHTYQVGYRTLDIAQQVWSSSDLAAVSAGELRRLRDITGETAYLAVAEGDGVLSIGRFEGPHSHRSSAALGSVKPMHCTSQGKSLLAFLPKAHRARIIGLGLERRTEFTITDPAALDTELETIRNRGYAIDDEEIVLGTRCVGAPILDGEGGVIAAVSVAGPTFRVTHDRVEFLANEVVEAARLISSQVGPRVRLRRRGAAFVPVSRNPAFVGGSPHWDAAGKRLFWIDQLAPALFGSDARGTRQVQEFETRIDAMALTHDFGPFVLAGAEAIRQRDGAVFPLPARVLAAAGSDACNRMVIAVEAEGEAGTQLCRFEPDGRVKPAVRLAGRVGGLALAQDGEIALACAPDCGTVWRIDIAADKARVLARIPRAAGQPVACTSDGQGRAWVALSHGWSVARLDDMGEIVERLPVPVPNPTGLCFGGDWGTELYVTTARYGLLDRSALTNAPLSGHTLLYME